MIDVVENVRLTEEQKEAAYSERKSIIVRAGAGTGKTTTLIERISFLIKNKVKQDKIFVVTFTKKAANEIKDRLKLKYSDINISVETFHSLALKIFRKCNKNKKIIIIDEEDTKIILRNIIERMIGKDVVDRDEKVKKYFELSHQKIKIWKVSGLYIENIEQKNRKKMDIEIERIAAIYTAYQYELDRLGVIEYSDIILNVNKMLSENNEIAVEYINNIEHLIIDEGQDANMMQVEMAKRISDGKNIFIVGDEDQSIFSFQGGFPEAISLMGGKNKVEFTLTRSKRCTNKILEHAIKIVNVNKRKVEKKLIGEKEGEKVECRAGINELNEANLASEIVKKIILKGGKLKDIAILMRSSFISKNIEESLMKEKLSYKLIKGIALTEREEIKDIVAFLILALNPGYELAFSRIVNKPTKGIGPSIEKEIIDKKNIFDKYFYEICAEINTINGRSVNENTRRNINNLGYALASLNSLVINGSSSEEIIEFILKRDGCNYMEYVNSSSDKDKKHKIERIKMLKRIAAEEPDVGEFIDRLMMNSDELSENNLFDEYDDRISISTIHSAKGLEWKHVICVGFDEDIMPNKRSIEIFQKTNIQDPWLGVAPGSLEEERRLAHVAFTRASETLHILRSEKRNGQYVAPSRFIIESGLGSIEFNDDIFKERNNINITRKNKFYDRKV